MIHNRHMTISPLSVHACARTDHNPQHSAPAVCLGNFHLRIFTSGHGWYFDGSLRHELHAGDTLILSPQAAGYVSCDARDPYDFYFINYNGPLAHSLSHDIIAQHDCLFQAPQQEHTRALGLCARMQQLAHPRNHSFNLCDALLAEILSGYLDSQETSKQSVTYDRLYLYLEENLNVHIHRDRIADRFEVHPLTLDRLCKQSCGKTVRQLHHSMRVDLAKILLCDPRNNVSMVAEQLGYDDPFHFSRVFKKSVGQSPKRFQLRD